MNQISKRQMALLLFCFLSGSSIINVPTPIIDAAGNGAWLSVWFAYASGLVLVAIILYLERRFPGLTFFDYSQVLVGKFFAIVLTIPMLLVIMMLVPYIVLDIGGFFSSTMLQSTPPLVIHFSFLLLACLTARAGIVVMVRMFLVLITVLLGFVLITLFLATPSYHPEYLLPIIPEGINPVLHGAYIHFGFPYAEVIFFTTILPLAHRDNKHSLGKLLFGVLFLYGLLISIVIVCSIMALGPLAGTAKFSLFTLARLISLQEIIERIESTIGMALIVGSYMKTTITLFILSKTFANLLNSQHAKQYMIPLSSLSLLLTMTMFRNESEFTETILVVWPMLVTTFCVIPLMVVAIVSLFRKKAGSKKSINTYENL
jgi:spore germination protein KB